MLKVYICLKTKLTNTSEGQITHIREHGWTLDGFFVHLPSVCLALDDNLGETRRTVAIWLQVRHTSVCATTQTGRSTGTETGSSFPRMSTRRCVPTSSFPSPPCPATNWQRTNGTTKQC